MTRRRLVAFLPLLALGLAWPGIPSASPEPASRIVFSREGDVWAVDADGKNLARLTTNPAEDFDPAWAPDGSRIAFRSHRDGNEEVYVMNADGSGQRNLTRNPTADYSPAWSPDGKLIAFMSDRSGDSELWLADAEGGRARRLTHRPGIDEYPSWSPDGRRIAFTCTGGGVLSEGVGDFELCVVGSDGKGLRQITNAAGQSKQPAWSPDGSRIAFESDREGWPCGISSFAWSPDRPGEDELYSVRPDGTGLLRLTDDPRTDATFPAWSPDGRRIVFVRWGELLTMAPDGSNVRRLLGPETGGEFPDWVGPRGTVLPAGKPAAGSPAAKTRVRLALVSRAVAKRMVTVRGTSNGSGRLQACVGRRLVARARVRGGRWALRLPRQTNVTVTQFGDARHAWASIRFRT